MNNGKWLLDLCAIYDLNIGETLFLCYDIQNMTWCSSNRIDGYQIDHLMINGTWRGSLLDVQVKQGADVSCDYYLVTAALNLHRTG